MDAIKPKGLTFPEGLDEAKVDGLIQTILMGLIAAAFSKMKD